MKTYTNFTFNSGVVCNVSRQLYKEKDLLQALEYALDALEIYRGDERAILYVQKLHHKIESQQRLQQSS